MAMVEQVYNAVAAHGKWKARLQEAVEKGQSEWTVEKTQPDNQCDFGKWLHSLSATEQTSSRWKNVKGLHADFHKEASRILGMALKGQKQEALAAMSSGSQFTKISGSLVMALMAWGE
jgi:methyl-accepting chemotaxis protein